MQQVEREVFVECYADSSLSREDKALVALAESDQGTTAQVRRMLDSGGVREAKKWNVSDMLVRLREKGLVSKHGQTWEIRRAGKARLSEILGQHTHVGHIQKDELRTKLPTIGSESAQKFAAEMILCLEVKANRAAVVMSWVGAISLIQEYALSHKPTAVDAAAKARLSTSKKPHRGIKNIDDYEKVREFDQLQIFEDAGVIGKSLKGHLYERLNLRNTCGHPNKVVISDIVAAAHVDFLITNVYSKFSG